MNGNPLLTLTDECSHLIHEGIEHDTSCSVVHFLAAETLVPCHEGRTGQLSTGTVVRFVVVVVCHGCIVPDSCVFVK